MVDLCGEVATYRNSQRRAVRFAHVTLDLRDVADWRLGKLLLHRTDGETIEVANAAFSALSADGNAFPVAIVTADGRMAGRFQAEAIVTGIPVSADCFLFSRRTDGFWDGVTITVRSGQTMIVPYACDSS